jgi:hypothetical protein
VLANGFYLSLQIIYHFFGDQTFLMRGNAQKEKSDDFHIFVLGEKTVRILCKGNLFLLARREKICYDYEKWISGLGAKGVVWESQILNGSWDRSAERMKSLE